MGEYDLYISIITAVFFFSAFTFLLFIVIKSKILSIAGFSIFITGIVLNTVLLILRWKFAGHIPLSNTYETMLTFAWMIGLGYFFVMKMDKNRILVFGLSILILLILGFTSFLDDTPRLLIPALQSNWLIIHVFFCFVSYAAFAISFIASIIYLFHNQGINIRAEEVIYKSILIGFPFLTLGIVTGAIWANCVWGRYWGWDPKEIWAFITWLVYAVFLHARYLGWKGKKSAWLSIIGFIVVLFTYFGVNFFLSGLHSYK